MATPTVGRLDANHDDNFGHGMQDYVSGSQATAQRLRCEMLLILGEWFLDTSAGVPWFQVDGSDVEPILGKMPGNQAYAEATIKAKTLAIEGIASIKTFDLSVNRITRAVTISVTVIDDDGNLVSITLPVP